MSSMVWRSVVVVECPVATAWAPLISFRLLYSTNSRLLGLDRLDPESNLQHSIKNELRGWRILFHWASRRRLLVRVFSFLPAFFCRSVFPTQYDDGTPNEHVQSLWNTDGVFCDSDRPSAYHSLLNTVVIAYARSPVECVKSKHGTNTGAHSYKYYISYTTLYAVRLMFTIRIYR